MNKMLIKNGNVVFDDGVRKADLLINGEKLSAIYAPGEYKGSDAEVLDVTNMIVMPGCIDPHMHMGLYKDIGDAFRNDTPRQVVGGLTTLINYHRGKGNYFDTVKEDIKEAEKNSLVDFAFSLGLCAKEHLNQIEGFINELGITSFKFFFDKQDIAHKFYGLKKEEALTLDKADLYFMLKQLAKIDPRLLLCVHCEDPDIFRALEKQVMESDLPTDSLRTFEATRPGFVETACMTDSMYINSVVGGNMYVVHTAAGSSVDMYSLMKDKYGDNVTLETCPQYLLLDHDAKAGLKAKVNPPLHSQKDIDTLWEGIRSGLIKTIGTDNVPVDISKKYEKGDDMWSVFVGFGSPGIILPALISDGYHKRNIPLETIAKVTATNIAEIFCLDNKGKIAAGYDADLAIVDLDWERTIDEDLFGDSDFSIYEGMSFKGWPRYTVSRGQILQKDGRVVASPGRGKYIKRHL